MRAQLSFIGKRKKKVFVHLSLLTVLSPLKMASNSEKSQMKNQKLSKAFCKEFNLPSKYLNYQVHKLSSIPSEVVFFLKLSRLNIPFLKQQLVD